MNPSLSAKEIRINGVVQGVGFRPFLFVLAKKHHLNGEVSNTDGGVFIFIEGRPDHIQKFMDDIRPGKPLLSSIIAIDASDSVPRGLSSFRIVKSRTSEHRSTLISPDVTFCSECESELNDPDDRRFEYPFLNCTNCGPRYTIIEDIPYDRPKTSMKLFQMCSACRKEYDNPLNRRFHAQPNACPECGPQVSLHDNRGREKQMAPGLAMETAADLLSDGKIIGIKGLGGFHLACDARNPKAVQRLRDQKKRPHKPFALMARSAKAIAPYVMLTDDEKTVLKSYHSPIVLLKKRTECQISSPLARKIAPQNNCIGVMLPSTPLHHLLLKKGPDILVMTSGNRSGEPLSIENEDAQNAFAHIADYFLLHNRDIFFGADDSVVQVINSQTRFIRRSRGYAPLPVYIRQPMPAILGCGAGLKNTICLTRDNQAFLSPHIGDLDNKKVFDYYIRNIDHLKRILDIQPGIIAHDLHPGYMSSEYAEQLCRGKSDIRCIAVQHHHAHAASCMAENQLDEPVIAITLDGTGLGTDNHIWGGEILVCDLKGFTRKAHLHYIPMPGGDAAVWEPWRMATALLYQAFGEEMLDLDLPFINEIGRDKLEFVCQMIEKDLNSPLTSSAGRLFDALSSLLSLCHTISYESQAAMELEAVAGDTQANQAYDYHILDHPNRDLKSPFTIDLIPAFGQIVEEIGQGRTPDRISADFHHTLVTAFGEATRIISSETQIKKVVLSGGVFNNATIFTHMIDTLKSRGLTVYSHSMVPTGDGGISLGQAVIAAAQEKDEAWL